MARAGPAFALALLVATAACRRSTETTSGSASVAESATIARPGVAVIDDPNYTARLWSPVPCQHAQTCTVHAEIIAKGEYHINESYPYKFRVDAAPPVGLAYPKPVVGRDDGQFEAQKAVLRVPFVAAAAGDKKVGGVLSLSVCSAKNCLMDKQALELTVKVD
jgi:hypothetical protein